MQNQAPSSTKKRIFQAACNQLGTIHVIFEDDSAMLSGYQLYHNFIRPH
jgi:hypothetical protein